MAGRSRSPLLRPREVRADPGRHDKVWRPGRMEPVECLVRIGLHGHRHHPDSN